MAGKPKNRLELRRQYEAAEPLDPMEDEADEALDDAEDDEAVERKPKKKPKAAPKPKVPKAPKPAARMRIVWTVVNDAFKPVGSFEYAQKEAAYARAAELTAKGKGTHFVQQVKEAMPDNAPGLGAALSQAVAEAEPAAAKPAKASKPVKAKVVKAPIVEEEIEDDDELDGDVDPEGAEEEDDDDEE
jgi:hypothetical protein